MGIRRQFWLPLLLSSRLHNFDHEIKYRLDKASRWASPQSAPFCNVVLSFKLQFNSFPAIVSKQFHLTLVSYLQLIYTPTSLHVRRLQSGPSLSAISCSYRFPIAKPFLFKFSFSFFLALILVARLELIWIRTRNERKLPAWTSRVKMLQKQNK